MSVLHQYARLLLLLLPLVWACGSAGVEVEEIVDPARLLLMGRRDASQWIAAGRSGSPVSPEVVVPLGYLERLRLGLGSPFRLIDQVLHDPRLEAPSRLRAARALLARVVDGQMYQVNPDVLDLVGLSGSDWVAGSGRYHLRLIDDAVSESSDPRVGELAVRLAYSLAAAEGSVAADAPLLAAQVAALIRDRELAYGDARRLIRVAQESGVDPVSLVASWRGERQLEVEQPSLAPLSSETEREAIEFALRLARTIQSLGPRLADGVGNRMGNGTGKGMRDGMGLAGTSRPSPYSLLGPAAARSLAESARELGGPPRTPVVVAVSAQRPELHAPWLMPEERAAWRRFLGRARDEEGLAAEYAILLDEVADAATAAGEAVLSAAVGLRAYAQESTWFPGFGGPTARELEDRFGLAAIRFDDDVPAAWRPYYRRVLAESLGELQRVLPALNVRGLSFHIGASRGGAATLALHDPHLRTIFLAPETGMGTLAHEVAHDLDWQAALRRYRVRGDYASDRAVRAEGDRLAGSVVRLTSTTLRPPIPGDPTPVIHAQRPAEVFARSVDWFVLAALASEGRSNGYLTSAQDAMLTGYGTARPPDLSGNASQALVAILDEIAPVYPATREWFLRSYGPNRALSPYDLVRAIVESGGGEGGTAGESMTERLQSIEDARSATLAAVDAWTCRVPATAGHDQQLDIARRQLVASATRARARGIALDHARTVAGERGRHWLAHQFYGSPWPKAKLEPVMAEFLSGLASEVERLGEVHLEIRTGGAPWTIFSNHCATSTLLALNTPGTSLLGSR